MPITYTNRKGSTYYLCRGKTKTGKPRYYFAREPKGEPLDEIPDGYVISESVNGNVSLARARQLLLLPEEVAAVETALNQHPKAHKYRIELKQDRILVFEQTGPDADEVIAGMRGLAEMLSGQIGHVQDILDEHARYKPVLRFILRDPERRAFRVQRMFFRGAADRWIDVDASGLLDEMVRWLIPKLGTDQIFDLY